MFKDNEEIKPEKLVKSLKLTLIAGNTTNALVIKFTMYEESLCTISPIVSLGLSHMEIKGLRLILSFLTLFFLILYTPASNILYKHSGFFFFYYTFYNIFANILYKSYFSSLKYKTVGAYEELKRLSLGYWSLLKARSFFRLFKQITHCLQVRVHLIVLYNYGSYTNKVV